jgi:citrate lyase subunit alpha / citrate CoA-transferase
MGAKDLVWFPSASFPCHEPVIELMKSGAVHHIEGSMNGPLGDYCSHGHMRGLGVLRSHGGRWQAVQDGEVHIDIAVIAAPTADYFGNADGSHGKSACGSLGFALADSVYADRVIVVTDNLVPFPCIPWQIQGNNVDYVVEVDSIGDPSKIVSGTTQITRSPDRLRISELVARFLRDSGIMRDGFSFQAGAGGIALAFVDYLARMMKDAQREGQLRARRLDEVSGRSAERRPDRIHPRRTDLRPRRGALDRQRSAACADQPIHLVQLSRQR